MLSKREDRSSNSAGANTRLADPRGRTNNYIFTGASYNVGASATRLPPGSILRNQISLSGALQRYVLSALALTIAQALLM